MQNSFYTDKFLGIYFLKSTFVSYNSCVSGFILIARFTYSIGVFGYHCFFITEAETSFYPWLFDYGYPYWSLWPESDSCSRSGRNDLRNWGDPASFCHWDGVVAEAIGHDQKNGPHWWFF